MRCMRYLPVLLVLISACTKPEAPVDENKRPRLVFAGNIQEDSVVEASGLARSQLNPGTLWVINDGGSKPHVHAFNFEGGDVGRLNVDGVENEDWEDLSSFTLDGVPYLLVADIGNNEARRETLSLYVVEEPDLAEDNKVRTAPSWQIDFRYPNEHHDAEAIAVDVDNERVLILTKRDLPPLLYEVPLRPAEDTVTASLLGPVRSLAAPSRSDLELAIINKDWHWQPTAMDLSPDGRFAVILTYRGVYIYDRSDDRDWYDVVAGKPRTLGLGHIQNAESVVFADPATIFITVERRQPPLLRLDLEGISSP